MGLPKTVRASLAGLDPAMQKAFTRDLGRRRKSIIVAYLAWFLLGWHYLYMGRAGMQFAFWFTLGGFFVWWLLDAVRLPRLIKDMNDDLARELMMQYRAMGA